MEFFRDQALGPSAVAAAWDSPLHPRQALAVQRSEASASRIQSNGLTINTRESDEMYFEPDNLYRRLQGVYPRISSRPADDEFSSPLLRRWRSLFRAFYPPAGSHWLDLQTEDGRTVVYAGLLGMEAQGIVPSQLFEHAVLQTRRTLEGFPQESWREESGPSRMVWRRQDGRLGSIELLADDHQTSIPGLSEDQFVVALNPRFEEKHLQEIASQLRSGAWFILFDMNRSVHSPGLPSDFFIFPSSELYWNTGAHFYRKAEFHPLAEGLPTPAMTGHKEMIPIERNNTDTSFRMDPWTAYTITQLIKDIQRRIDQVAMSEPYRILAEQILARLQELQKSSQIALVTCRGNDNYAHPLAAIEISRGAHTPDAHVRHGPLGRISALLRSVSRKKHFDLATQESVLRIHLAPELDVPPLAEYSSEILFMAGMRALEASELTINGEVQTELCQILFGSSQLLFSHDIYFRIADRLTHWKRILGIQHSTVRILWQELEQILQALTHPDFIENADNEETITELLKEMDNFMLPHMRKLGIPQAFSLPVGVDWIVDAGKEYVEGVRLRAIVSIAHWLSRHSVRGSALSFSMLGPHLRRQYIPETDAVDLEIMPILLSGLLPALHLRLADIRSLRSSGSRDEIAEAEVKDLVGALLNGLFVTPYMFMIRTPEGRIIFTLQNDQEALYMKEFFNPLMRKVKDLGVEDPEGIIQEAVHAFPEFITPTRIPDFLWYTGAALYGRDERKSVDRYNMDHSKWPGERISLWEMLNGSPRAGLYRETHAYHKYEFTRDVSDDHARRFGAVYHVLHHQA